MSGDVMAASVRPGTATLPKRFAAIWNQLSLALRFTIAACPVTVLSMIAMGTWVSRQIELNVIDNAAAETALNIGHFIAPHLQELESGQVLSSDSVSALDKVMRHAAVGARIQAIKIWLQDGTIVYSTNKSLIGRRFEPEHSLRSAWAGAVTAEFDQLESDESESERGMDMPLLEVYAPVFATTSSRVIAVAEFYENARGIYGRVRRAQWQSWMITALLEITIVGTLFSIVADGSRTINRQRLDLIERISELSSLLDQNRALRSRVERAARRATEDNERFLRQIGSDLHDGPAQLIGLALLRLGTLEPAQEDDAVAAIHGAMTEALEQIRNISGGLLLPETESRNLRDALLFVIREHERRTGTTVSFATRELPDDPAHYIKLCLCRFVQEGLTNAFRHAEGKGQLVCAWREESFVCVEVSDRGPGMPAGTIPSDRLRLGLIGLRGRIESIGGSMTVTSHPQGGTCLTARLPLTPGGTDGGQDPGSRC